MCWPVCFLLRSQMNTWKDYIAPISNTFLCKFEKKKKEVAKKQLIQTGKTLSS